MELQNNIDQLDLPKQQQIALNILRDYMIFKSITVIEHDDLIICDAIFNQKPYLAMFWFKTVNEKFRSHKELHNNKMQASEGVFLSLNLINIFCHNIYYFIV